MNLFQTVGVELIVSLNILSIFVAANSGQARARFSSSRSTLSSSQVGIEALREHLVSHKETFLIGNLSTLG